MTEEIKSNPIPENHHLTRYDTGGKEVIRERHYWTFAKSINNHSYSKSFTSEEFGSVEAAHIEAKKYRDNLFNAQGVNLRDKDGDASLSDYINETVFCSGLK
jgi:hypothetical protein